MLLSISVSANAQELSIEKITVTATRSSNNVMDIGSNISWLDDESLRLIEQQHINQALVHFPRSLPKFFMVFNAVRLYALSSAMNLKNNKWHKKYEDHAAPKVNV